MRGRASCARQGHGASRRKAAPETHRAATSVDGGDVAGQRPAVTGPRGGGLQRRQLASTRAPPRCSVERRVGTGGAGRERQGVEHREAVVGERQASDSRHGDQPGARGRTDATRPRDLVPSARVASRGWPGRRRAMRPGASLEAGKGSCEKSKCAGRRRPRRRGAPPRGTAPARAGGAAAVVGGALPSTAEGRRGGRRRRCLAPSSAPGVERQRPPSSSIG